MLEFTGNIPISVKKTITFFVENRNRPFLSNLDVSELTKIFQLACQHSASIHVIPIDYRRLFKGIKNVPEKLSQCAEKIFSPLARLVDDSKGFEIYSRVIQKVPGGERKTYVNQLLACGPEVLALTTRYIKKFPSDALLSNPEDFLQQMQTIFASIVKTISDPTNREVCSTFVHAISLGQRESVIRQFLSYEKSVVNLTLGYFRKFGSGELLFKPDEVSQFVEAFFLPVTNVINDPSSRKAFLEILSRIPLEQRKAFLTKFAAYDKEDVELVIAVCKRHRSEIPQLLEETDYFSRVDFPYLRVLSTHLPKLEKNFCNLLNIVKYRCYCLKSAKELEEILIDCRELFLGQSNNDVVGCYLKELSKFKPEKRKPLASFIAKHFPTEKVIQGKIVKSLDKFSKDEWETIAALTKKIVKEPMDDETVAVTLDFLLQIPFDEREEIVNVVSGWMEHVTSEPEKKIPTLLSAMFRRQKGEERAAFVELVNDHLKSAKDKDICKLLGYWERYDVEVLKAKFSLLIPLLTTPLEITFYKLFNHFMFWENGELAELIEVAKPIISLVEKNSQKLKILELLVKCPRKNRSEWVNEVLKRKESLKDSITDFLNEIVLLDPSEFSDIVDKAITFSHLKDAEWHIIPTLKEMLPEERNWILENAKPFLDSVEKETTVVNILSAITKLSAGRREQILKAALPYLKASHKPEERVALINAIYAVEPSQEPEIARSLSEIIPKVELKKIIPLFDYITRVSESERSEYIESYLQFSQKLPNRLSEVAQQLANLDVEDKKRFLEMAEVMLKHLTTESEIKTTCEWILKHMYDPFSDLVTKHQLFLKSFSNIHGIASAFINYDLANVKLRIKLAYLLAKNCGMKEPTLALIQSVSVLSNVNLESKIEIIAPFIKEANENEINDILETIKFLPISQVREMIEEANVLLGSIKDRRVFYAACKSLNKISKKKRAMVCERFKNYYAGQKEKEFITIFELIPTVSELQWNEILEICAPIFRLVPENQPKEKLKVIQVVLGVRRSQRSDCIKRAVEITSNVTTIKELIPLIASIGQADRDEVLRGLLLLRGEISPIPLESLFKTLNKLPRNQREEIVRKYLELFDSYVCDSLTAEIIEAIAHIPQTKLTLLKHKLSPILKKFPGEKTAVYLMKKFNEIPEDQWDEIIQVGNKYFSSVTSQVDNLYEGIGALTTVERIEIIELSHSVLKRYNYGNLTAKFLTILSTTPKEKRQVVFKYTLVVANRLGVDDIYDLCSIFKALRRYPVEEMQEIVDLSLSLGLKIDSEYTRLNVIHIMKAFSKVPLEKRQGLNEDVLPLILAIRNNIDYDRIVNIVKIFGRLKETARKKCVLGFLPFMRVGYYFDDLKEVMKAYVAFPAEKRSHLGSLLAETLKDFYGFPIVSLAFNVFDRVPSNKIQVVADCVRLLPKNFYPNLDEIVSLILNIPEGMDPIKTINFVLRFLPFNEPSIFMKFLEDILDVPENQREELLKYYLCYRKGESNLRGLIAAIKSIPPQIRERIYQLYNTLPNTDCSFACDKTSVLSCLQNLVRLNKEYLIQKILPLKYITRTSEIISLLTLLANEPEDDIDDLLFWYDKYHIQIGEYRYRSDLISAFRQVPKGERPEFFSKAQPFLAMPEDGNTFSYVTTCLRKFPVDELAELYEIFQMINFNGNQYAATFLILMHAVNKNERRGIVELASKVFSELPYDFIIPTLIENLLHLPSHERERSLANLKPFLTITNRHSIVDLMLALTEFSDQEVSSITCLKPSSDSQNEDYSQFFGDLSSDEYLVDFIIAISKFPKELRKPVIDRLSHLCAIQKNNFVMGICNSLLRIDPRYFDRLTDKCLEKEHVDPMKAVKRLFLEHDNIRQETYEYLLKRLELSVSNQYVASRLSKMIIDDTDDLLLHTEHPLIQKAIEMYVISDPLMIDSNRSPYRLYHEMKRTLDEEKLIDKVPGKLLNLSALREYAQKKKYTIEDLPKGLPFKNFKELFQDLSKRVSQLSGAKQQQIYKFVKKHCLNQTIGQIKGNFLNLSYTNGLFDVQGPPNQIIEASVFYIYTLLKCLCETKHEVKEDTVLTLREENLLHQSLQIALCPTGQRDGIAMCYNDLPIEYRSTENRELLAPAARARDLVFNSIQTVLHYAFSNFALLKKIDPQATIDQHPHNINFLKNRLHLQVGYKHVLNFDQHAGVINAKLKSAPLNVLLEAFFDCVTDDMIINGLKNDIAHNLSNNEIRYNDLISLIETKVKLTHDNYPLFIIFDEETTKPLGVTHLGAVTLLRITQFFGQLPPTQF